MDTRKRRPPRRKRTTPPRKRLPGAGPSESSLELAIRGRAGLDQAADHIRALHEQHRQRGFAAISAGFSGTPLPAAERGDEANFAFDVSEPPVSVVPTAYPSEPGGAVLVQNNMTINVNTIEFRGLNSKLDEIITLLRTSNKISGEPRDQLSLRSRLAKFSSVRRNQTLR
jgi:hypothetical protein